MKNFSLGCAFNLNEILMNFPYKDLHTTCSLCHQVIGDNHRDVLVKKIFKKSVELVLKDIVNNNVTFWLPITGNRKCNIHIRRVQGEEFKRLRRGGKWEEVDIVNSLFSGYEICFYMLGNRTPRVKKVYVDKALRDKITSNTNNKFQYGDSNNDKYIQDYYQHLYLLFPDVPQLDIRRILGFSWKALYLHNSYGGDTILQDKNFWCYIGNLKKNSLQHFEYYIKKLIIKLRVLYKRKQVPWDGCYYFALGDSQYQSYLQQKNKKGRPRKFFNFENVCLYQILDECKLKEHSKKYIFRLNSGVFIKTKYYVSLLKTDKASLLEIRAPLKFKDILVSNNKYEFL